VDTVLERTPEVTTVSLPLAIWGTGYAEFLPRWWDGVESLERQPDEIVCVADSNNYEALVESCRGKARLIKYDGKDYADFWNKAIEECSSEWVAICNVDDKFLPQALNDIEKADAEGCNLICDSIQDKHNGSVYPSSWRPHAIATTWTMVGAEPMKKSLWEAAGGFLSGYLFADWQLAMGMAKSGTVNAYDSSIIRIIYDRGDDRPTLSGINGDPQAKNEAHQKLRLLAQTLGL